MLLTPLSSSSTILGLAIGASAAAIVIASRLNRWYIRLLERSLVKQADGIDVSPTADDATRKVLRRIRHDADQAARDRPHRLRRSRRRACWIRNWPTSCASAPATAIGWSRSSRVKTA